MGDNLIIQEWNRIKRSLPKSSSLGTPLLLAVNLIGLYKLSNVLIKWVENEPYKIYVVFACIALVGVCVVLVFLTYQQVFKHIDKIISVVAPGGDEKSNNLKEEEKNHSD